MKDITFYGLISLVLLIIGGLNWLLVGLLDFNLVFALFGNSILAKIVYTLVGVAAIYIAYLLYLAKTVKII